MDWTLELKLVLELELELEPELELVLKLVLVLELEMVLEWKMCLELQLELESSWSLEVAWWLPFRPTTSLVSNLLELGTIVVHVLPVLNSMTCSSGRSSLQLDKERLSCKVK